jgi:hypothetical protein
MNDEFDYELTPDQWEALKSLRNAASRPARMNRFTIDSLIVVGLAAMSGDVPIITSTGRKALVRGSSLLLHDLAA